MKLKQIKWDIPKHEWTVEEISAFNKRFHINKKNNDWIVWLILGVISLSGIIYFVIRGLFK